MISLQTEKLTLIAILTLITWVLQFSQNRKMP